MFLSQNLNKRKIGAVQRATFFYLLDSVYLHPSWSTVDPKPMPMTTLQDNLIRQAGGGSGYVSNVAGAMEVEGNTLMVHVVMDGGLLWLKEVVCDGWCLCPSIVGLFPDLYLYRLSFKIHNVNYVMWEMIKTSSNETRRTSYFRRDETMTDWAFELNQTIILKHSHLEEESRDL